jgi:hypothetical protein
MTDAEKRALQAKERHGCGDCDSGPPCRCHNGPLLPVEQSVAQGLPMTDADMAAALRSRAQIEATLAKAAAWVAENQVRADAIRANWAAHEDHRRTGAHP